MSTLAWAFLVIMTIPHYVGAQSFASGEVLGERLHPFFSHWDARIVNNPEYGLWDFHSFSTEAVRVQSDGDGVDLDTSKYRLVVTEHGYKRARSIFIFVPEEPFHGSVDVRIQYMEIEYPSDFGTSHPAINAEGFVRTRRPSSFLLPEPRAIDPSSLMFPSRDTEMRVLDFLTTMDGLNHLYLTESDMFRISYYPEDHPSEAITIYFNLNGIADLQMGLYR